MITFGDDAWDAFKQIVLDLSEHINGYVVALLDEGQEPASKVDSNDVCFVSADFDGIEYFPVNDDCNPILGAQPQHRSWDTIARIHIY